MDEIIQLNKQLSFFPKVSLLDTPTPIEELPSISELLNRRILIKRDDDIGPGLGGNKTRKLEYLIADAIENNYRKVVTFGGLQSNHVRLTAAVAVKFGLEPHLFYFEHRPAELTGNLYLNKLLGAHMHFIPIGGNASSSMSIETTIRLVHWISTLVVGNNYYIPVGGHSWLGCLGYVQAAIEIAQQVLEAGIPNARIITAAGSGGTLAGLLAGLHIIKSDIKITAIDVGSLWKNFSNSIANISSEITKKLGFPHQFNSQDIPIIEGTYVGKHYGIPSPQGIEAIHLLAEKEGILLDPVYTSKAFAGLMDLVKQNKIKEEETIIFLHTGGKPALFAFEEQLLHHG